MGISQQALARQLKLSVSTVSRAFHPDLPVAPEARARVLALASELGYSVPADGRRARRKEPANGQGQLVVLIPRRRDFVGASRWPHATALASMSDAARSAGLRLDIRTCRAGTDFDVSGIEHLAGVALMLDASRPFVERLARLTSVACLMDDYIEGLDRVDYVQADSYYPIGRLFDRLHDLGHRRIGFMPIGSPRLGWVNERYAAYCAALHRHGLAYEAGLILEWPGHAAPSRAACQALDRALDAGATAWMCCNDQQAAGLVAHLRALGLSVPGDVSVTGFDGMEPEPGEPRITSMRPPAGEMGYTLVRCLLSRTARPAQPGRRVLFECHLVEGETVQATVAAGGSTAAEKRGAPQAEVRHRECSRNRLDCGVAADGPTAARKETQVGPTRATSGK